jgi:hypothetical protein
MYRHEFRKKFAMMQPPEMHEICPRGTKTKKKCNEQKLISIFHFFFAPISRILREEICAKFREKPIFLNVFPP